MEIEMIVKGAFKINRILDDPISCSKIRLLISNVSFQLPVKEQQEDVVNKLDDLVKLDDLSQ